MDIKLLLLWVATQSYCKTMVRYTWKLKVTISRKRKYFTVYVGLLETFSWCKVKISSYLRGIVNFH